MSLQSPPMITWKVSFLLCCPAPLLAPASSLRSWVFVGLVLPVHERVSFSRFYFFYFNSSLQFLGHILIWGSFNFLSLISAVVWMGLLFLVWSIFVCLISLEKFLFLGFDIWMIWLLFFFFSYFVIIFSYSVGERYVLFILQMVIIDGFGLSFLLFVTNWQAALFTVFRFGFMLMEFVWLTNFRFWRIWVSIRAPLVDRHDYQWVLNSNCVNFQFLRSYLFSCWCFGTHGKLH